MGTSTSSRGPGSHVPLIPPWVPDVAPLPDAPSSPEPNTSLDSDILQPVAPETPAPMMAPARRFAAARHSLTLFSRSGDQRYLKSGLRHYAQTGLGGARRAAQRMGGTATTAGRLYAVLNALRTQGAEAADEGLDPATLRGRSARDICDRIVEAVRPPDGTLDTAASRESIASALSELMRLYPDADLLALTPEQIEIVFECYLGYDTCRRVESDIGLTVYKAAPSASQAALRMNEIKTYVREKVYACFRALRKRGRQLTKAIAASFAARVIEDTFTVFEEFVR
jgi:hypothetical protein